MFSSLGTCILLFYHSHFFTKETFFETICFVTLLANSTLFYVNLFCILIIYFLYIFDDYVFIYTIRFTIEEIRNFQGPPVRTAKYGS